MKMNEFINQYLLQGYATTELSLGIVFICVLCTSVLSLYVYAIYKRINKNSFYNRNFNLSLIALAIITSAIILTIQSNIVVSLGMVGALSIVRFRTAIKDPLDLIFMFWAIGIGIICGAGFIFIAVLVSLALTIILLTIISWPVAKRPMILVVNADDYDIEDELIGKLEQYCKQVRIRAKNITKNSLNIAIEIETTEQKKLMKIIVEMEHILSASLVENEGDVTV